MRQSNNRENTAANDFVVYQAQHLSAGLMCHSDEDDILLGNVYQVNTTYRDDGINNFGSDADRREDFNHRRQKWVELRLIYRNTWKSLTIVECERLDVRRSSWWVNEEEISEAANAKNLDQANGKNCYRGGTLTAWKETALMPMDPRSAAERWLTKKQSNAAAWRQRNCWYWPLFVDNGQMTMGFGSDSWCKLSLMASVQGTAREQLLVVNSSGKTASLKTSKSFSTVLVVRY